MGAGLPVVGRDGLSRSQMYVSLFIYQYNHSPHVFSFHKDYIKTTLAKSPCRPVGASPSPPPPQRSSGRPPAPFCRLYLTSTSGVCLSPRAPLVFSSKKTTLAKNKKKVKTYTTVDTRTTTRE